MWNSCNVSNDQMGNDGCLCTGGWTVRWTYDGSYEEAAPKGWVGGDAVSEGANARNFAAPSSDAVAPAIHNCSYTQMRCLPASLTHLPGHWGWTRWQWLHHPPAAQPLEQPGTTWLSVIHTSTIWLSFLIESNFWPNLNEMLKIQKCWWRINFSLY